MQYVSYFVYCILCIINYIQYITHFLSNTIYCKGFHIRQSFFSTFCSHRHTHWLKFSPDFRQLQAQL